MISSGAKQWRWVIMSDNEFLLALRNELQPLKEQIRSVQNDLNDFRIYIENEIEPKIQLSQAGRAR